MESMREAWTDERLDAGFDRLDAKIDKVGDRLDTRIDRLDGKIDRLGDRLDGKIDAVDSKITTFGGALIVAVVIDTIVGRL